jgi:putative FmdB family regulatory protein
MPIYEYVCSSCGKEFEAIQKFSDDPLTVCSCGESGSVERKLSLSAFQLKGGGWYKDLYGGKNGVDKSGGTEAAGKSGGAQAAAKNGGSDAPAKSAGTEGGAAESKKEGASAAACGPACACATP